MSDTPTQLGPYRILAELGRGAMGVVYRALHEDLGHELALKVILDHGAESDSASAARFQREARAAAQLAAHPNVVGVHDVGVVDGQLFLAMDLVRGVTLDSMITAGELTPVRAAELTLQVANALSHAHAHGILHRDVKPGNILVGYDGQARLTDFGLATSTLVGGDVAKITSSEILVGTPAYASPEQIRGAGLDARADIYSLGATLYEALCGREPYRADALQVMLLAALEGRAEPPSRHRTGIPAACDAIAMRCLALDPDDRYSSAADLAEDLQRFIAGEPVVAQQLSAVPRAALQARRWAPWVGAAALVAAAATVGIVWAVRAARRGDANRTTLEQTQHAHTQAERRRTAADEFDQLMATTGKSMHTVLLHRRGRPLPAPALQATLDAIATAADRIREADAPSPTVAAWVAYSRALAAQPDGPEALAAAARAAGPTPYPHVLHALGLFQSYVERVQPPTILFTRDSVEVRRLPETPEQRALRQAARDALPPAGTDVARQDIPWARFAAAADAIATAESREASARAAELATAVLEDPLFGQPAAMLQGLAWQNAQRYPEAVTAFARAGADGWPHALIAAGYAALAAGASATGDADTKDGWIAKGLQLFDAALAASAADAAAVLGRGSALWLKARMAADRGDAAAEDLLREAVGEFTRAADSLDVPTAHVRRGNALVALARWLADHGRNPSQPLQRALSVLRRVRAAGDRSIGALHALAEAWLLDAEIRIAMGSSADASLEAARGACGELLAADPADTGALVTRGLATTLGGVRADDLGGDARAEFRAAINDFDAALRMRPTMVTALSGRAGARRALAMAQLRAGEDPIPLLRESIADFETLIDLSPREAAHRSNCAYARISLAQLLRGLEEGGMPEGDYRPVLESALADLQAAIGLNPQLWQAHAIRGQVYEELGRDADALGAYEAALAVNPQAPTVAELAAAVRRRLGR